MFAVHYPVTIVYFFSTCFLDISYSIPLKNNVVQPALLRRLKIDGLNYFRDPANWLDFFLVISSDIDVFILRNMEGVATKAAGRLHT